MSEKIDPSVGKQIMLTEDRPISEWYVKWANSLDSAGYDSTPVKERLDTDTVINELDHVLEEAIEAARRVDNMKKFLFYGKPYRDKCISIYLKGDVMDRAYNRLDHDTIRLLHAILGKIDEAGELASALRDHLFTGSELDQTNIIEEVGDSRWYDALIARWAGYETFDEIDRANYRKLTTRYPDKVWTQNHALDRDLSKEREALDGRDSGTGNLDTP